MGVDREMVDWCDICGQDPITLDDRLKSVTNRGRITRFQVRFGVDLDKAAWVCSKCRQNLQYAKMERLGSKVAKRSINGCYSLKDAKVAIAQVTKERAIARLKGRKTTCL